MEESERIQGLTGKELEPREFEHTQELLKSITHIEPGVVNEHKLPEPKANQVKPSVVPFTPEQLEERRRNKILRISRHVINSPDMAAFAPTLHQLAYSRTEEAYLYRGKNADRARKIVRENTDDHYRLIGIPML